MPKPDPDQAYDEKREERFAMLYENEPICPECEEPLTSKYAQCKFCGSSGGGTD